MQGGACFKRFIYDYNEQFLILILVLYEDEDILFTSSAFGSGVFL